MKRSTKLKRSMRAYWADLKANHPEEYQRRCQKMAEVRRKRWGKKPKKEEFAVILHYQKNGECRHDVFVFDTEAEARLCMDEINSTHAILTKLVK